MNIKWAEHKEILSIPVYPQSKIQYPLFAIFDTLSLSLAGIYVRDTIFPVQRLCFWVFCLYATKICMEHITKLQGERPLPRVSPYTQHQHSQEASKLSEWTPFFSATPAHNSWIFPLSVSSKPRPQKPICLTHVIYPRPMAPCHWYCSNFRRNNIFNSLLLLSFYRFVFLPLNGL